MCSMRYVFTSTHTNHDIIIGCGIQWREKWNIFSRKCCSAIRFYTNYSCRKCKLLWCIFYSESLAVFGLSASAQLIVLNRAYVPVSNLGVSTLPVSRIAERRRFSRVLLNTINSSFCFSSASSSVAFSAVSWAFWINWGMNEQVATAKYYYLHSLQSQRAFCAVLR